MALLRDPATPVEQVAALIREQYAGEPVMPGLAGLLREYRGSTAEVVAVAEALHSQEASDREEPSLSVLTFGAHAARLADDHARARELMDQALARADDPELLLLLLLATHLSSLGRTADAIDLVAAHVADPAYDAAAVMTHQSALEDAQRHLAGEEQSSTSPCGSGVSWSECCRTRGGRCDRTVPGPVSAVRTAYRDR